MCAVVESKEACGAAYPPTFLVQVLAFLSGRSQCLTQADAHPEPYDDDELDEILESIKAGARGGRGCGRGRGLKKG